MRCGRPGCPGTIVDGWCDDCGLAPARDTPEAPLPPPVVGAVSTSQPVDRRPGTTRTAATRRGRFGGGLVKLPPVPVRDPSEAVLVDAFVPEHQRFCSSCGERVGRGRDGKPGRTEGFCRRCGAPFSFTPALAGGDLVAGQYEIVGCLAHGGLGWIYLARDRKVSDRWVVLKGLLDSHDEDAVAVAVAERGFLAQVEHPNIVQIHNFVEHDAAGYIVMEYVNGISLRQMLDKRRAADGGDADPMPVELAIAACLDVLPALGHLHELGLAYCDFKPDNVMLTPAATKLIDLGGVYRMGDRASPIYGTVGYQAPEVGETRPTVASDLYTVGRTLAVLCLDSAAVAHRHELPTPGESTVLARHGSLHAFLQRATAPHPPDRFQHADEMAGQLVGVLRQVVATTTGEPAAGVSAVFTGPRRGGLHAPDHHGLPSPLVDPDDPAASTILSLASAGPDEIARQRAIASAPSLELDLWWARALLDAGRRDEAAEALDDVAARVPRDWRVWWYRALLALDADASDEARRELELVARALPGELAPTLALGVAAERAGDAAVAAARYDVVSRTDPGLTAAAFGLARCRRALGDTAGAIAACRRVPDTSIAHTDSVVLQITLLLGDEDRTPQLADVVEAAALVERLELPPADRDRLAAAVLEAARRVARIAEPNVRILGRPVIDRDLRLGLETVYRSLARRAPTALERVALVDRANAVRPRSWW